MIKLKNIYLLLALTLTVSLSAQAQDLTHQINASGTSGEWDFGVGDGDDAVLGLTADYRLGLDDMFQIGALVGYAHTDAATAFAIGPGVIINFMDDIKNSAFVGAYYVWSRLKVDGFSAVTTNQARITAGKRFEIVSNVSYEPYIEYTYGFGDEFEGDRNDLSVTFLSFTATF
ncbi:hypothetical protein GW915_07560 [bacterium]|nr:hypothetical protein [bacterium]